MKRTRLLALCLFPALIVPVVAQTPRGKSVPKKTAPTKPAASKVEFMPLEDARPVLLALNDAAPAELRAASDADLPAVWAKWTAKYDADIRARVTRGDEDSLVNFLFFGTTFTAAPRFTAPEIVELNAFLNQEPGKPVAEPESHKRVQTRIDDLLKAVAKPAGNERLLYLRQLLDQKGFKGVTDPVKLKAYVMDNVKRVLREQQSYGRAFAQASLLDPSDRLAEVSKIYKDRGLSSDTSIFPNYAIEAALKSMLERGWLKPGGVLRVGIVGPGLDFTDKQEGYDFYPQQTLQPFAVMDSLVRLGLSDAKTVRVTTLDISPAVNAHLEQARKRAEKGADYVVQLPYDTKLKTWSPEVVAYWEHFGDRIGGAAPPVVPPARNDAIKLRAAKFPPSAARAITPLGANIVLQRANFAPEEKFDIIVATNILVYYDVFEQCLALKNIETMLAPGGFLLSNNALLELPSSKMHSAGYVGTAYSNLPADGDFIIWYQKQ